MKDNFSQQADQYAKYRPTYPPQFFNCLNNLVSEKQHAWDCGTGNGQVAIELAKSFNTVFETDISQAQIDNAQPAANIVYSIQPAEHTHFTKEQFDLIVVAQAIHWFDFEKFYKEVFRTAKANALICVLGYGRIEISEPIDALISDFYKNIIGPYWDKERNYIDENYATIPFPFEEIPAPTFENQYWWTLNHLVGYLNTWSAVKHFIKQNGFNPVDDLGTALHAIWPENEKKPVRFPMLLRLGRIR